MDRREFMKAGVAAGAAQYAVAETAVAETAAAADAKTTVVAAPAWLPITTGAGAAEVAVRQRVREILIVTNGKYAYWDDTLLKFFLDEVFKDTTLKKLDLYGLFKDASYEAAKLMAIMGIRWRRKTDLGARKHPLVKMVALDETHIPSPTNQVKKYRRYLKFISRQMYDKLDRETPNGRVDLVVQNNVLSDHLKFLADQARHPGRGSDRPRLRERIAQDNTRFIEIELSSE